MTNQSNSWRVTLLAEGMKYTGTIKVPNLHDKRTSAALNSKAKAPDLNQATPEEFITLRDVELQYNGNGQNGYTYIGMKSKVNVNRNTVLLGYDGFPQMGDPSERNNAYHREQNYEIFAPQHIHIITKPFESKALKIEGDVRNFYTQYREQDTPFLPISNGSLEKLVAFEEERSPLQLSFFALNKDYIQSYWFS